MSRFFSISNSNLSNKSFGLVKLLRRSTKLTLSGLGLNNSLAPTSCSLLLDSSPLLLGALVYILILPIEPLTTSALPLLVYVGLLLISFRNVFIFSLSPAISGSVTSLLVMNIMKPLLKV